MQKNSNLVARSVWRRWSETSRRVFNETYSFAVNNKKLCVHPKARSVSDAHWNTTAWNIAWAAANLAAGD